jgi:surface polysaccharide O-acyltransferase-like enzyme
VQRQIGIDFGRVCAIVAVMALHAGLDRQDSVAIWYVAINQLARFAVPFFFVAMGYFSHIAEGTDRTEATAFRLLGLYVVWIVIGSLTFGDPQLHDWRDLISGGRQESLWFLFSAAICLPAVAASFRFLGERTTMILAVALYVAGLVFGAYSALLWGHDLLPMWNTRDGLTFGAPFIAAGVWIARHGLQLSMPRAAALLAAAAALQLLEAMVLYRLIGTPALQHDFLASTSLYGIAAFLFFQSLPAGPLVSTIGRMGLLVLGLYVIHPLVGEAVQAAYMPADPLSFAVYLVVVFAASGAIAAALYALPATRPLVTTAPSTR